ncbi:hypothetical protein [Roseicyclus amphidinii]|uniref:hypothetical protein n=1 Tax=Roseicyclus amphidinii TaxID=3034232 RepID=UPI0024E09D79|nr:hypothetical protein [Roseicyclus sp. Amp-Y-6]
MTDTLATVSYGYSAGASVPQSVIDFLSRSGVSLPEINSFSGSASVYATWNMDSDLLLPDAVGVVVSFDVGAGNGLLGVKAVTGAGVYPGLSMSEVLSRSGASVATQLPGAGAEWIYDQNGKLIGVEGNFGGGIGVLSTQTAGYVILEVDDRAQVNAYWGPNGQSLFSSATRCFPASTPVAISLTDTCPISDIRVGDTVLAFDPSADLGRGALVPRKVTRLYRNTTEEWIRLSWREEGEEKELVTTPGHHFLDRFGNFPTIEQMLAQGRATVVLASGELTEVTAERIIYSAETAHLFEQAQAEGVVAGSAALKPAPIDAWQTYNFEVEDLHTYVAGGVRVHNQSGFDKQLTDKLYDAPPTPDALGAAMNLPGIYPDAIIRQLANGTAGQSFAGDGDNGNHNDNDDDDNWSPSPGWNDSGQGSSNGPSNGNNPGGGFDHSGSGTTTGSWPSPPGQWEGGNGNQNHGTPDPGLPSNPDYVGIQPIVLDLDGDGIEVSLSYSASFDYDGDGFRERTAWAAADDAFLVIDLNADGTRGAGDGLIDQRSELVLSDWGPEGSTDLQALAEAADEEGNLLFDTNGDGVLDANDTSYGEFRVWQDLDQDGGFSSARLSCKRNRSNRFPLVPVLPCRIKGVVFRNYNWCKSNRATFTREARS